MKKHKEHLAEDARQLNEYLYQYKNCIGKKRALENRRQEIIREFNSPLNSIKYDGMPRRNREGLGSATLSFRMDEIDERIKEQLDKATRVLTDIMDIIEFLPENSTERSILEHKYIDRYSWEQICRIEHMSRTPATQYWRKGLLKLLEFEKVKTVLAENGKKNEAERSNQ